jgi:predicted kinase
VLAAGTSVVLDATFLDPARRAAAEALALQAGVPFHGAWLAGDPEQLRARLAQRAGDASDADAAVLERQMARPAGTIDWEVLSATDLDAAAARLRARFSPANAHGAARGRG